MSSFGILNTAVSGLAAQASYLGTIGDNISNSSTTGYKQASAEFETLLSNQTGTSYESGGVQTRVRYGITDQGTIVGTSSVTDLAISGNGFFVVQSPAGTPALTRAGAFVPNASGNLINSAGYQLISYNLTDGSSDLEPAFFLVVFLTSYLRKEERGNAEEDPLYMRQHERTGRVVLNRGNGRHGDV